ncbi:MAG: AI-2E family transporter YdiK [Candidatus Dasytiphilus stammeri]
MVQIHSDAPPNYIFLNLKNTSIWKIFFLLSCPEIKEPEENHCSMKNISKQTVDIPQLLFLFLFITILIVICFWVVQPFLAGFTWASMVVIATWPLFIKIQNLLWGSRILAIVIMILMLFLFFITPLTLLLAGFIDNIIPLIQSLTDGPLKVPQLHVIDNVPLIGDKLYFNWNSIFASDNSNSMMTYAKPYIGKTTGFIFLQVTHLARVILHLGLMLLFSVLLYWRGEQIGEWVSHFTWRLATHRGEAAILLTTQAIRAVALGVSVTALVQGILGGVGLAFSGIPYAALLTGFLIFFCLMQLGTLPVLIPAIIWLYWGGENTSATILMIWSCLLVTLDNILRPILIRMGADLPMIMISCGVIGGLFTFGMIGLFIGPVVLAISYKLLNVWMHDYPVDER